MKATLKATLMLCALAAATATGAAQHAGDTSADAPPGLQVSGFEWKYEGYAPFEVVRGEKTADSIKTDQSTQHLTKGRQS